jgi:hypothetical protein
VAQRLPHSRNILKSFEVQTFRHGKWSVDSVFDDHQLAVFEARRMDESGRFGGVRVVEETWDPNTNNTKTRTVFRDQAYHKVNQEILDRNRAKRQQKTESVKRKVDRTEGYKTTRVETQRARIRKKSNPVRLIAITIGIALLAMAAGAFLERIEHMF